MKTCISISIVVLATLVVLFATKTIDLMPDQANPAIDSLEHVNKGLMWEILSLQDSLLSLKDSIEEKRAKISLSNERIYVLNQRYRGLIKKPPATANNDDLREILSGADSTITELESRVQICLDLNKDYEQAISNLERNVSKRDHYESNLKKSIEILKKANTDQANRIAELEKKNHRQAKWLKVSAGTTAAAILIIVLGAGK